MKSVSPLQNPTLWRSLRNLPLTLLCASLCFGAYAQAQPDTENQTASEVQPAGDARAVADQQNSPSAEVTSTDEGKDDQAEDTILKKSTETAVSESTSSEKGTKKEKGFLEKIAPIIILLIAVAIVLGRLPKPDFDGQDTTWRSQRFLSRRVFNWLPLGLTYALLYMGRYNLKVSKFQFETMKLDSETVMMSNEAFGIIFAAGTVVYGFSFIINGPLTDRLGGRFAILLGAMGACVANLLMGLCAYTLIYQGPYYEWVASNFVVLFSILYGLNMYFQSFGAVAIVKVNASWFHLRERGVFGAIFGILISLGIYLAFDVGGIILERFGLEWVFFIPALLLFIFFVIDHIQVRNTPGEAGLVDFDTADASSGDEGDRKSVTEIFKMMLSNPIIITIALVEFCSGFIRQAPMQWYRTFAKQTDIALHLKGDFIYENWGMLLCVAGILGGVVAGVISDRVFQSRRGPVAAILYGGITIGSVVLLAFYDLPAVQLFGVKLSMPGVLAVLISMLVIGVHGMLSGTASMDFGGKKNVGVVVGIIDGFVYLGTAVMSLTYAAVLPHEQLDSHGQIIGPATVPSNWVAWPISMIIVGVMGTYLATRVWNAKPTRKSA